MCLGDNLSSWTIKTLNFSNTTASESINARKKVDEQWVNIGDDMI